MNPRPPVGVISKVPKEIKDLYGLTHRLITDFALRSYYLKDDGESESRLDKERAKNNMAYRFHNDHPLS